ncbi:MAG TPA: hypothetical protein VJ476_15490 [Rhizomicrobium sp.]|nr:hypothetical protein [Rhizomicrobium sp.]
MNMTEDYRGFVISWQEPPRTSAAWTANVASEEPDLYALMGGRGAKVIDGQTRGDMIAASKKYVDGLLG